MGMGRILATSMATLMLMSTVAAQKILINEFEVSTGSSEYVEFVLLQDMNATELDNFYFGDSTSETNDKRGQHQFMKMQSILDQTELPAFPQGTIIVVGDSGFVSDNINYNPVNGDWDIILSYTGSYILASEFRALGTSDVAWVDGDPYSALTADGFAINWDQTPGTLGSAADVNFTFPVSLNTLIAYHGGWPLTPQWARTTFYPPDVTVGYGNSGENRAFIDQLRAESPTLSKPISFQGRLNENGVPAYGTYDFQLQLHGHPTEDDPKGQIIELADQAVENGLFTASLIISEAFMGLDHLWVDIKVKKPRDIGYTQLSPRQRIQFAPKALRAEMADEALVAIDTPNAWKIGGNELAIGFLGTLDTRDLEFRVNNQVAMRFEDTAGTPNLVGGALYNNVSSAEGAVIGGGGEFGKANQVTGDFGTVGGGGGNSAGESAFVGGGVNNSASNRASAIAGGSNNQAIGLYSSVGGGILNRVEGESSSIGGGSTNDIDPFADFAVISGGKDNHITSLFATIGGGSGNSTTSYGFVGGGETNSAGSRASVAGGANNQAQGDYSSIGGGTGNTAFATNSSIAGGDTNSVWATSGFIGGGEDNAVNSSFGAIAGGNNNKAGANAFVGGGQYNNAAGSFSVIGGGGPFDVNSPSTYNEVHASYGTIGGGRNNQIGTSGQVTGAHGTIGGGSGNTVKGDFATVPGGLFNTANGDYSFAAGHYAITTHEGTFVWADHSDFGFASTGNNQFLIRAVGGVGIGENNPSAALDVTGDVETSGEYSYSSPKTYSCTIAPVSFMQPSGSGPPYSDEGVQISADGVLLAPVNLPQGANIIEVRFMYAWTDARPTTAYDVLTIDARLYRRHVTSSSLQNVVVHDEEIWDSSSTGIDVRTGTNVTNGIVDNMNYIYHLRIEHATLNSMAAGFYGAQIIYTTNTVSN